MAATPEATRCQAREEREGRVAYLRNPVPNGSRPGQRPQPSSERTARKVRPPLSVFWRLPGVVEVGALLLPLSYFYPPSWVIPPSCLIPPTGVGLPSVEAEESEPPGC